jgi:hypothetical protein
VWMNLMHLLEIYSWTKGVYSNFLRNKILLYIYHNQIKFYIFFIKNLRDI